MNKPIIPAPRNALITELKTILGEERVSDRLSDIELMSQDIWALGVNAAFVAAPSSVTELSKTVAAANQHGVALNPRGGGMSYTKGYLPDRDNVGLLDFSNMNRIIEINEDDMYVTVEAGCTWDMLHKALQEKGLRTPFWGPLSGLTSTVGGGVSQNNAFFGCGLYGTTAESVLAVTVVLADGTVLRTGTSGVKGGKPFFRYYGPDLTGLFCGDCGALGFKAEITLKLMPVPAHEDWASFEFTSRDACAEAMQAVMKENIACEVFGFDPNLQRVRLKRASIAADVKTLGNVVKSQGSLLKGLKEGAKIALAGRSFVDDAAHTLHFVVEGQSAAAVAGGIAQLKGLCEARQGKETENSIPKIIRANPFGPLNNILGPEGERWVPIHGIVAPSDGPGAWADIERAFDAMRDELDAHEILTGFLITTLGATGYLIEPVFIWPEEIHPIHEQTVEADFLAKLPRHQPNPKATAIVEKARQAVLDVFTKYKAAHFQIGRTYPYKENSEPEAWAFLEKIKRAADPQGRINPGVLGLGGEAQARRGAIRVRNPRTGEHDYEFAPYAAEDIEPIAARLREAQPAWAALSLEERGMRLQAFATALRAHRDGIADALEIDTGRRRIARLEVDGVAASIESWIAQAPALLPEGWSEGKRNPAIRHAPQFVPYGLVGVISPWNFPLTLSMIDTIPALLAGCAVMIKPSEVTPRFIKPLEQAIAEAGLADLLALAPGDGETGAALIEAVDAACFTGSVPTGRKVAAACAARLIPAFLELGGKDPLIVTASADLDQATNAALRGSVLSTGQACQSIERIYVDQTIYDQFTERLAGKALAVRLNWPDITQGELGPLIFDRQADILKAHIEDALAKGARLLCGGEIEHHGGGLWLRPTVLADVTHEMAVMRDETFGPIMPVMACNGVDEAVALANDTEYGLSAAVFAGSLEEAESVGRRIDAGAVSLNDAALTAMFHEAEKHAFKCSGLGGSRMGPAGFQRFLRRKALIANTGAPAPIGAFAEDAS